MKIRSGFCMRLVLVGDLILFVILAMLFVYLPVFPVELGARLQGNVVTPVEWVLTLLGLVPLVLLFGRFFSKPHVPYNEWAYLATGGYGLLVVAAFFAIGTRQVIVEPSVALIVAFMCFVGVAAAAGAHVVDGGSHPNGPMLELWLKERNET